MITGVFNRNNQKIELYKNGVLVIQSNAFPFEDLVSSEIWIGRQKWLSYFKGSIDDVMIFNRSLSAEEIQALVHKGILTVTKAGRFSLGRQYW